MYSDFDAQQVIAAAEMALFVSFVFGVALHEAGHAIAARLLGLDLRLISLGQGPAVAHFRLFGVAFVLHGIPLSGFVAIAVRPGMSRLRFAGMIAAGPGVNAALLVLATILDQVLPYYDAVLMPIMVSQGLLLLITLTPYRMRARGGMRASDGQQLWTQLVRKPPDMFTTSYAAVLALIFPKGEPLPPPSPAAPELLYQIARSDRYADAWGLRDAVAAIRRLLGPWQLNPAERAVALDFLASAEVLFGGTGATDAELEAWSVEACALAPVAATTLTRVGVLATTGRGKQAIDLLVALPTGDRPLVAIFRYWLHMAQAGADQGLQDTVTQSLELAHKAAGSKVAQSKVMKQILARAQRQPPLAPVDPARRAAITAP